MSMHELSAKWRGEAKKFFQRAEEEREEGDEVAAQKFEARALIYFRVWMETREALESAEEPPSITEASARWTQERSRQASHRREP